MTTDNQSGFLSPSLQRSHLNSSTLTGRHSADHHHHPAEDINYREQQLLQELSTAREELAMLKRASSAMDEPFHRPTAPSTLPSQRRALLQSQQHQQQHIENRETFLNRHQTQYQSHHDIQQG